MKKLYIICCILLSFGSLSIASEFEFPSVSPEVYYPDSIKAELESWIQQSQAVHPKFDNSIDFNELIAVKDSISNEITIPMNQLEVFRVFSRLNSVLADGHHGIVFPRFREQIAEAVKQGDRLFPLRVHIGADYSLAVEYDANGIAAGTTIKSINGVPSLEITKHIEQHIHGDNPTVRRALLSNRFTQYLWMFYGTSEEYVLDTDLGTYTMLGVAELPPHRRSVIPLDDNVSFEILNNNQTAYLEIKSFNLYHQFDEWFPYTDSIFTTVIDTNVKHLVIDLRQNTGGFDDSWIHGIMPYIAKKKWQRMLHFLGRVRPTDGAFPGRVGEVAIFDYQGEYASVDTVKKFNGEVYVIVGDLTYSSSTMFSSAIKDNGLGKIVGTQTAGRGCQTGMPQLHDMPVTGLVAFTPQHWYQRNTKNSCNDGVEADIELYDNPFDEMEIIESLIKQIL